MANKNKTKKINRLMIAVVQEQDIESAARALSALGLEATRLPSTGAFLGRRNATLFIGMGENQEKAAIQALKKSCRRRVEYVATPLEGSPLPFPSPAPITVGGATIFSVEVERYVEF